MAYSKFDAAELDGKGGVTVSGPINFAAEEQGTTVVTSLNFVLVQGDVFVHGAGATRGEGGWGGQAELADELVAGEPAQGFGVALLVRRAQEATQEAAAHPPVVQTLNWSETITIT
jgi:hypothetical protein